MKCFISRQGEVLGPYSESEIHDYASGSDLIWMSGIKTDWLTKDEWVSQKNNIKENVQQQAQPVIEWYYAVQGKRFGPMKKAKLVKTLTSLPDVKEVKIWHKELKGWTDIYEFKDIIFAMGHDNRKNPRVTIDETIMLTVEDDEQNVQSIICKGTSLSSDGVGLENLSQPIQQGGEVDVNLSFLQSDLRVRCKVINADADEKTANLEFSKMQQEARSVIMDFVQKKLEETVVQAA